MPYRINDDGTATPVAWTAETEAAIDAGEGQFYLSVIGCVLHGSVQATPIKITRSAVYDAMAWLTTGAMVPAGEVTTVEREVVT